MQFGIPEIYEYQICLFNAIFRCLTEFLWISMDMFNYYMFFLYDIGDFRLFRGFIYIYMYLFYFR